LNELNDSRIFIAAHGFIDDEKALAADAWDMLVVDEAHHFDLVDDNSSGQQLKHLAAHSTHLLLLSATPERLGLASHFSRLQLLDAEKFYSFDDFKRAYDNYQTLANDLQALLDSDSHSLTEVQLATLQAHFQVGFEAGMTKAAVMELLLDSLGTGRMIYRNTRHGVAGFPKRQLVTHQLADNEAKLAWLADFVKQHKDEKLLLITHQQEDVLDLKVWLYRKAGIDCPVFHEDMTLIERDRAAAYFADSDEGAPLLLCSEIGSEGRNFQFCHRLICWDLPDHPDVLEQRIGRLDRIGQKKNIEIHVCVESEASAKRLYWFHDVLGSIEQINPAAGLIHDQWYSEYCDNPQAVEPKIKSELHALLQQLEQGRDRLLEMNSCRQPDAAHLVAKIQQLEADSHPQELLESIVDVLNIHYEQLDSDYFRLVPSDQMLVPMIPGIPAEGCEITFDRKAATAREEVEFITWDHPLMQGLAEMITQSELGVASVGLLPNKTLRPGMLFVEVLFTLSLQSEYTQHVERYLTQSGLRIVVTKENANNLSAALPSDKLSWLVESASKAIRHAVVKDYRKLIDELVDKANQLANAEMATIVSDSLRQLNQRSQLELARLTQLQQRNAAISDDSIVALREHYQTIAGALEAHCQPVVSAIRLLVTYRPETE
jgi:ATP-dependent helicase HepA